ncbi:MAG: SDR family oxidoreductase [Gammaproteobacteria bacterium]|nr:SDR family oxidoreductase [Gammaproteobacteria bacterium]
MNTPSFRLDGKVAMITGASSGIGARLAQSFAAAGAAVALVARRRDRLEALEQELLASGAQVVVVELDINDHAALPAAFASIEARLGVADVVINNAGIAAPATFLKTTADVLHDTMSTNFESAWHVTQEAARRLVAARKPGSIINVASVLALGAGPGYAAYSASKAALVSMTRSLALEFVRYRIRVNALAPGWFVTEMNRDYFATAAGEEYLKKIPPGRAGQLDELVGPALLLASDAGSYVNGVTLPVDGGHSVALV